jgi:hypothetical protein
MGINAVENKVLKNRKRMILESIRLCNKAPLRFIPCYKSGGALRGLIWSSEVYAERGISKNLSQFPAPLAYNVTRVGEVFFAIINR